MLSSLTPVKTLSAPLISNVLQPYCLSFASRILLVQEATFQRYLVARVDRTCRGRPVAGHHLELIDEMQQAKGSREGEHALFISPAYWNWPNSCKNGD